MNCQETQARFDDRLDQRLPDAERTAFDQHVAGCAVCRHQWQTYAGAWGTVHRYAAPEPSFGFAARALRQLDQPVAPAWWPVWRWAVLALVVIALSAGGVIIRAHRAAADRVAFYEEVQQSDCLDDYDVIAHLDQLEGANHL